MGLGVHRLSGEGSSAVARVSQRGYTDEGGEPRRSGALRPRGRGGRMAGNDFAAIDEQRMQAFHWRAMLTTGLGVFCDGYDISSIALVRALALHSYGVAKMTSIEAGALTASALVGSMLGALIFGALGQLGRKRFY